jgi:hypothetical protein
MATERADDRAGARVSVERLMREIEGEVRRARRARFLAPGGSPAYEDAELFAIVEQTLRRALEERDPTLLILPELLGEEKEWRLETQLRFSSHRPALGSAILWVKRRVVLPLTRWLYEYSLENFKRQQHINTIVFACLEELAIENARLRRAAQFDGPGFDGGRGSTGESPAE